jgi:hypothetical protein
MRSGSCGGEREAQPESRDRATHHTNRAQAQSATLCDASSAEDRSGHSVHAVEPLAAR